MDCFQNRESDIEGTTIRVASVTLESDSLSEAPKSFRSKRRKRIPKREKQSNIENDFCNEVCSSSFVKDKNLNNKMEWETAVVSTCSGISSSEFESDFELNGDADDEQSDWPDAAVTKTKNSYPSKYSIDNKTCSYHFFNNNTIKLVEQFLLDVMQKEIILYHVHKLSQKLIMKLKNSKEDEIYYLTVNVEIDVKDYSFFNANYFDILISSAIKKIFGVAAPNYVINFFNNDLCRGCLKIKGLKNMHLIWSALSIYGQHLNQKVAIHFHSVQC